MTAEIDSFLKEAFSSVWVAGEVQRPRSTSRGHLFFELVEKGDDDSIVGRIEAVLFHRDLARARRRLRVAGEEIVEGQTLRCGGEVDFYPRAGRLQLVVREVDPLFTVGVVAQRRRETLAALAAAGDLDRNRRLSLPAVPLRVGLVTSKASAAYHDFVATLTESGYGFSVRLVHASVQGATAAVELVRALQTLEDLSRPSLDVLVLVRGGGARSDFHCYDDPRLAAAIARSRLPVLTGLGHEIDETIADRVAHSALKTPTKAAELLVERVAESDRRLEDLRQRLGSRAEHPLARASADVRRIEAGLGGLCRLRLAAACDRLAALAARFGGAARREVDQQALRCARLSERLAAPPRRLLAALRREQALVERRLGEAARRRLRQEGARLEGHERIAHQLSPQRLLERGFSVTRSVEGSVLRDAAAAPAGARVRTELASGSLLSRVERSE